LTEERERFVLDFKEENDDLKSRIKLLEGELDLIQHEYNELLTKSKFGRSQRTGSDSSEGMVLTNKLHVLI
jgi:hypothetical protein